MQVLENISLKPFNTFGIDVKARHYISVSSVDALKQALSYSKHAEKFILGGGSNMLLTKDIDALVIHLNLKGIDILSETDDHVIVKAEAGENWHDFVIWCLEHDFGGVENLSLIPGNVGTAPIQNIGAYGVELKDVFVACQTIELEGLSMRTLEHKDCHFGYRDSVFKGIEKGKQIITAVIFQLTKKNHTLRISYGAITSELENMNIVDPTIQDISKAVISIRQRKLPDPVEIGNGGSFFKNPVISILQFTELQETFPNIPSYVVSDQLTKIPAGWLIEKAGFKGKRFGDYGVHENQALVLVNYDSASGSDILELAKLIQSTVHRIFGISLETEVNIF